MENMLNGIRLTIESQLANQFFTGGFLLGLMGTFLIVFRQVPGKLGDLLINRFTTRVYVDSMQDTYHWIHVWMSYQDFGHHARRLSIRIRDARSNQNGIIINRPTGEEYLPRESVSQKRERIIFSLGEGRHFVCYHGKWLMLELVREKPQAGGKEIEAVYEAITIRYLGTSRNIMEEIIEEAIRLVTPSDGQYVDLYSWNGYTDWIRLKRCAGRNPDTLIYRPGLFDNITAEIRQFRESRQWYHDLGIPYKKTFLLHGPPGSGKTSMVMALSTLLESPLYSIDLSTGIGDANSLLFALHNIPENSIILIEDIHTVGSDRKIRDNSGRDPGRLTVEGLTNILDGALSAEGTMIILTTNYPELLDERLIRSGRIDRKIYLGNACHDQIRHLAKKFYPQANGEISEFLKSIPEDSYSMAQLQEYFLQTPLQLLCKKKAELDQIKRGFIDGEVV